MTTRGQAEPSRLSGLVRALPPRCPWVFTAPVDTAAPPELRHRGDIRAKGYLMVDVGAAAGTTATPVAARVLEPGQAGCGEARRVLHAMIDCSPAVIVRCHDTAGVASAVEMAVSRGSRTSRRRTDRASAEGASRWP